MQKRATQGTVHAEEPVQGFVKEHAGVHALDALPVLEDALAVPDVVAAAPDAGIAAADLAVDAAAVAAVVAADVPAAVDVVVDVPVAVDVPAAAEVDALALVLGAAAVREAVLDGVPDALDVAVAEVDVQIHHPQAAESAWDVMDVKAVRVDAQLGVMTDVIQAALENVPVDARGVLDAQGAAAVVRDAADVLPVVQDAIPDAVIAQDVPDARGALVLARDVPDVLAVPIVRVDALGNAATLVSLPVLPPVTIHAQDRHLVL